MGITEPGIHYVRAKPHLFLRNGVFDPKDVCGRMATQAFLLGATTVRLMERDSWWIIESDHDWLSDPAEIEDPLLPFRKILSNERLGQNSCYGEVVLAAFADVLCVFRAGREAFRVCGEGEVPREVEEEIGDSFAIVFALLSKGG